MTDRQIRSAMLRETDAEKISQLARSPEHHHIAEIKTGTAAQGAWLKGDPARFRRLRVMTDVHRSLMGREGNHEAAPEIAVRMAELNRRHTPLVSDLSATEAEAARQYGGYGYSSINRAARSGKLSGSSRQLHNLIDRHASSGETTLYRGVTSHAIPDGDLVGHEFTDHGFSSASTSQKIAERFAPGPGSTIVHITAPTGTKMVDGFGLMGQESEHEILIQHGTRFRVTKQSADSQGRRVLHVKVVSQ